MKISERIRDARRRAGLTQAQFAERLGVTPQCVSQYERGVKMPKRETIQKMANALGVSAIQLNPDEALTQCFDSLSEEDQRELLSGVGGNRFYAEIAAAYMSLPPDKQKMVRRIVDDALEDMERNKIGHYGDD